MAVADIKSGLWIFNPNNPGHSANPNHPSITRAIYNIRLFVHPEVAEAVPRGITFPFMRASSEHTNMPTWRLSATRNLYTGMYVLKLYNVLH